MFISKKQLNLLHKISKEYVVRTDPSGVEDIEYLRDNGLVSVTRYEKTGDCFFRPQITEKGKAFLYERKNANRRANIALVLSMISLAISLLSTFTDVPQWIREFISSLLQSL